MYFLPQEVFRHSTLDRSVHLRLQTDYIFTFIWIFIFSSLVCWDISAVRQNSKTLAIFCVYLLHNCWLMSFMRIKKTRKMNATLSFSFWTTDALKSLFLQRNCLALPNIYFYFLFLLPLLCKNTSCFPTGRQNCFMFWKFLMIPLGNCKAQLLSFFR